MKTIYIVTSGCYSDYRIDGVFDTNKLAQSFIDSFAKNSEFDIEEYELNPFKRELNKNYSPYFVRMKRDGECTQVEKSDSSYGFEDSHSYGFDIHKNMYNHIFAKNKKHAIKITNEKRTELIALNKWEL